MVCNSIESADLVVVAGDSVTSDEVATLASVCFVSAFAGVATCVSTASDATAVCEAILSPECLLSASAEVACDSALCESAAFVAVDTAATGVTKLDSSSAALDGWVAGLLDAGA